MKFIRYYFLGILTLVTLSNTANGQTIFDKATATFKMSWTQKLSNAFYHLKFENNRTDQSGNHLVFKASAYYRISGDNISGTWFDSRGISFPLKGNVLENELTIIWGSEETEKGKTIYSYIQNEQIIVKDFIYTDSQYVQFGQADYRLIE